MQYDDLIISPIWRLEMANHRGGSGNFAEDRERASEAGRKGGQHSGGNFKNDPQRASEAGQKGGKNSHGSNRNK
jgi:general stress protein YciG